jgi:hypothetical protein
MRRKLSLCVALLYTETPDRESGSDVAFDAAAAKSPG